MQLFLDFLSSNLPKEFVSDFLDSGKKISLKKKEYFIQQGEFCKYIAVILKGEFLTSRIILDGTELTLGYTSGYDLATDYPAFLNGGNSLLNIQAISDCELLLYTKEQFEAFFEYNMDTQRYGRIMAQLLMTGWETALISLYCETPEERYLKLLHQTPDLFQKLPLRHIASLIGVTPETLSRIRRKLATKE